MSAPDKPGTVEPDGGNMYLPHKLMLDSGTFWRCEHGLTGLRDGGGFVGCIECAHDHITILAAENAELRRMLAVEHGLVLESMDYDPTANKLAKLNLELSHRLVEAERVIAWYANHSADWQVGDGDRARAYFTEKEKS